MNNEMGLEDEFVTDRLGTVHKAIDVFRTGEFQGKHNEQLRIIKLVEANAEAWSKDCTLPIDWKHCQNCWQSASLIALIKGEEFNNEEFSGTSISNHVAKQRRTIRRYP